MSPWDATIFNGQLLEQQKQRETDAEDIKAVVLIWYLINGSLQKYYLIQS